jgi:hypothetical protein
MDNLSLQARMAMVCYIGWWEERTFLCKSCFTL